MANTKTTVVKYIIRRLHSTAHNIDRFMQLNTEARTLNIVVQIARKHYRYISTNCVNCYSKIV